MLPNIGSICRKREVLLTNGVHGELDATEYRRNECLRVGTKASQNLHESLQVGNFDIISSLATAHCASNLIQIAADCPYLGNTALECNKFLSR